MKPIYFILICCLLGLIGCSKGGECTCTITYNYEDSTGVDHVYYSLEGAESNDCEELANVASTINSPSQTKEGYFISDYEVKCYDD